MSEPFIGQITLFPYPFPPKGWADCLGQLLPIAQNTALFSLLGTQYGGDGKTTFALPNLQSRVAVGQGMLVGGSTYMMGETAGAQTVTVDQNAMPSHTHTLNATTSDGTTNTPAGNLLANVFQGDFQGGSQGNVYNPAPPDTTLVPASVGPAGGSQPHNNMQPYLALRYCIALTGIFPPRS